MHRNRSIQYGLALISLLVYGVIGYSVPRHETVILFTSYFSLFGIYLWTLKTIEDDTIRFWIYCGMAFRVILLFATPMLSDDVYRFIWDGRLLANGFHPFAELPGHYIKNGSNIPGVDESLYLLLNSKEYFTIYPPLSQFIFWIAAIVFPQSVLGSMVVMRLFIIAAEAGSLLLISKLLRHFNISDRNVLIYAINPLVILELTGNLHFEALVIFLVLLSLFLLLQSKTILAGGTMAMSIATKLIPVIFLPLFLTRLGWKRALIFYAAVAGGTLLLFSPMLIDQGTNGFGESLSLFFKRFEFNASIYYLVREYGFMTKGYNIIQTAGWKLAVVSTLIVLLVSFWPYQQVKSGSAWRLKNTMESFPASMKHVPQMMMWVLFIYFLFTTTLHPWYITTLLMFSVFGSYRFALVWTGFIFLTYFGYSEQGYSENLYLTALEYFGVIGYLVYEWIWLRKSSYT